MNVFLNRINFVIRRNISSFALRSVLVGSVKRKGANSKC